MIQRFRQWLRGWLGVPDYDKQIVDLYLQVEELRGLVDDLERQLVKIGAIRQKASAKPVQRYTDYESSQKAVLSEFEGE